MDACLSPSELDRLASGLLRGAARSRADGHLMRCAACSSRLEAHRPAPAVTQAASGPKPTGSARASQAADSDAGIEGFRLLDEIHRGGQGVVWRALDEERGEIVALKILREGPFATADQRMRFDREIELARGLDHPLIVAPLQTGVSRGRPYHVMRFIEGLTLDAWRRETQPSLPRMLEVFRDACDAVAHAHARGVVHRDLKPSNILVDARGKPHVVDFGVAKSSIPGDALPLTVTGEFVGTLSHASPEQAQGDPRLVDERTDVYALGLILYELLTGRMPYVVTGAPADVLRNVLHAEPRSPTAIDPAIDQQLSAIVLRALAKEPQRRYPSVAELRDDVDAFLAGMPVRARPDGAWELLSRTARKNRRSFLVAAAFAVVLAGVAALSAVQAARFSAQRDRAEAAEAEARARTRELEAAHATAQRNIHVASVAAAGLALQAGRLDEARRRLEQSPQDLRGWEWAHLSLAADASEAHAEGDGEAVIQLGTLPDGRAWRATRTRLDVLDASSLQVVQSRPLPSVPRADETAAPEILTVAQDASLVALRWDDASWARLGPPGRAILVADWQGRIQAVLEGAAWRPDRAAFAPDARRLAAATAESYDAAPRVWSTLTGQGRRLASPAEGFGDAAVLAWSPDGALLAEGGRDGRVRAWGEGDAWAWQSEPLGDLTAIAWSGDGARAASATADGAVRLFAADGSAIAGWTHEGRITALALDHDGDRVAAGDDDGNVTARSASDGRTLLSLRGHETAVSALAFAGADETLLSAGADGGLRRWRADDAAGPAPLLVHEGSRCVAFSPDGLFLASGSPQGLRVFDVHGGRLHAEVPADSPIVALDFVPDGSRILTASASGEIALRDMAEPQRIDVLGRVPSPADVGAFGDLVAAVGAPGVLAAWKAGGSPAWTDELPSDPLLLLVVDADRAGVLLRDGQAIWGEPGGWTSATMPPGRRVRAAAARREDDWVLARGFDDGTVSVHGASGEGTVTLRASALAWAPDGSRLFAGDDRGVLSVLSVEPLEVLLTLPAHDGPITSLAVSPDGRSVAASGPGGVRLFRSR